MKISKRIDSILLICALAVSVIVALLAAIRAVSMNTAVVFIGLSIACIAMSLIDVESPRKERKKNKKSR